MSEDELPIWIRYGFSSLEFDMLKAKRGFTAHLSALAVWVELELIESLNGVDEYHSIRSISSLLQPLVNAPESLRDQRLQWITQRLASVDDENLFFRWLKYKAANALTPQAELALLRELLAMEIFPDNRLPNACDRRADYLWSRDSRLYHERSLDTCHKIFSGVDFIWMAALLQ